VHELTTGPHSEVRQELLLAAHPLDAVARVHRHGDGVDVAPRPGLADGVAVDERGEA
jgi:hypothetical protein